MVARVTAFVVWAALAACVAYWGLRVLVTSRPVPPQTVPVASNSALRGDVSRLFGASAEPGRPSEPGVSSRFKLIGVMAPPATAAAGTLGLALLAVDGKPPRPYKVGARIDSSLILQSVSARGAAIGPQQGDAVVRLELPPLPPPATGTLPNVVGVETGGSSATPPAGAVPPLTQTPPPGAANPFPNPAAQPAPAVPPGVILPQGGMPPARLPSERPSAPVPGVVAPNLQPAPGAANPNTTP